MNAELWKKLELVRHTGFSVEYLNYLSIVWMSVSRQPDENSRTKGIREFGPVMLDYTHWLNQRIATLNEDRRKKGEKLYTLEDSYFEDREARKNQQWNIGFVDTAVEAIRREIARENIDFTHIALNVREIFVAIQGEKLRSRIKHDFLLK